MRNKMQYYLAPMEGITTYIYRNAYHKYFGDIDKYFTPFIASKKMNSREKNDILPEHNKGINLIPQILTNRADEFLQITDKLAEYGYTCVNLNLGCPSGTVTARKRGSGFLSVPDELDKFLYEIFEKSPIKISIKTRIGVEDISEWDNLLDIYNKYPLDELIIHTRLQKEFYNGIPHKESFARALDVSNTSLCYNGDINSCEKYNELISALPDTHNVMIGRGVLQNPLLIACLKNSEKLKSMDNNSYKTLLQDFHNELFDNYASIMSGETPALYKLKDLWTYMSRSFTNPDKYIKKIRKANSFSEYTIAVNNLFREQSIIIN